MKKNTFLLPILVAATFYILPSNSFAQTPKITPTEAITQKPTSQPIDDTLKSIKEKIENKVDEINKSGKKVLSGILTKISNDILEIDGPDGKSLKVSTDSTVTKYFSSTTKKTEEIDKTDLEKGDLLVVFGPIIEDQISANKIISQSNYVTAQGEITSVDKDNLTIDIVTSDKEEVSLDIETATLQQIMDTKTYKISKGGFSKFKVGDKIHAVYIKPVKTSDKATTIRTLIIPQEFFSVTLSPTPKN